MEQLWVAFVVLAIINFILFICIAFILIRVGKVEDRIECLDDPDEFDVMMNNLRSIRTYRDQDYEKVYQDVRKQMHQEHAGIMRKPPEGFARGNLVKGNPQA